MLPTFIITTEYSTRLNDTIRHLESRKCIPQVYISRAETSTVVSINAAHRAIVQVSHIHDWPMIAVLEDDCFIPAIDGWQYFLAQHALFSEFAMHPPKIYSACNYHSNPTVWTGAHCYIIHAGYYNQFLSTPPDAHIDSAQPPYTVQTPPLICALQRPGYSANNREWVDHNVYLQPKQVYGGIPEWRELPDAINQQIQQP